MRCGAALSEHPLATQAVGECVGHLLEVGGERPDLLMVFATAPHRGVLEDVVAAARALLTPTVLCGSVASTLVGWGRSTGELAALSMFALWADDPRAPAAPARSVRLGRPASRPSPGDLPRDAAGTLLVIADPFSWRGQELVDHLGATAPGVTVVGGTASGSTVPGGNRLLLDGEQYGDGAVGVLLDPTIEARPLLSRGCRPIGPPYTVTSGGGNRLVELGGVPAQQRLREGLDLIGPGDVPMSADAVRVGRLLEVGTDPDDPEGMEICRLVGVEAAEGALVVEDPVEVGDTVQFQRCDETTRAGSLAAATIRRRPRGAVVFSAQSRSRGLLSEADSDGAVLAELFDDAAIAGMSTGEEVAPTAGRSRAHHGAVAMLLFGERNRVDPF